MLRYAPSVCLLLLFVPWVWATESPLAGTWKITLYERNVGATLWLIEIDEEGKGVKLLQGLQQFSKARVSEVKQRPEGGLTFTLSAGTNRAVFYLQPPQDKDGGVLLGCVRVGNNVGPIRLERTNDSLLDDKAAVAPIEGVEGLQEVLKEKDAAERVKQLRELIKEGTGKPLAQLASQLLISDLARSGAKPETLRAAIETYLREAGRHGSDLVLGLRFNLARDMINQPALKELAVESAREAVKLLRPDQPGEMRLAVRLLLANNLQAAGKKEEVAASVTAVRQLVEELVDAIKEPLTRLQLRVVLANTLLGSPAPGVAEMGLKQVREAATSLKDDMPLAIRLTTNKVLLRGLKQLDKKDELPAISKRVEQLEVQMDAEFRKTRPGFEIDKYTGRKPATRRVVLVELFSGAQNPLCLASDAGYDGALATYPPEEAVFIQYATHGPLPSAVVHPSSETRFAFYKADLEGIPGAFVDGKLTANLGGPALRGRVSYETLREAIDNAGAADTTVKIQLRATRQGSKITVRAEVSGVEKPADKSRLFVALVDGSVRYTAANGRRLHQNVVRAFVGSAQGVALTKASQEHSATIDLNEMARIQEKYLNDFASKNKFRWGDMPMYLGPLRIVAWVQDPDSKQVYQAAMVAVPE